MKTFQETIYLGFFLKKYGDIESSNIFLTKLSENLKTNDLIIKAFNSSLLINDWSASTKLAKKNNYI